MKKAVMYGAGNIGRGFIGQLFSMSGYETVFVDVAAEIVESMNINRCYPVRIVSDDGFRDEMVTNIRAVNGLDMDKVSDEISDADIMATAVGVNVLPKIIKPVACGIRKRWEKGNYKPLNIIICENLLHADSYLKELLKKELSEAKEIELFDKTIGLVEASIGRMVPVMTEEMKEGNLLRICVEQYCELPVDKDAFKGEIPEIVNMVPFSPFEYYIQRKLYIHNMGHAIAAYLGYLKGYTYIWEAIRDEEIRFVAKCAMKESAQALSMEHGFPLDKIVEHVDYLIGRFGNRQLGDTIERVGRDPLRKLSSNDRLAGALKLCIKHGVSPENICIGLAAALSFSHKNDSYAEEIQNKIRKDGPGSVLQDLCGITAGTVVYEFILNSYKNISQEH